MAKIAQFPGATIELGKIIDSKPGQAVMECKFTVHSPARLFWWAVRTHHTVLWWQWPRVIFIVIGVAILHGLGRWEWFGDEG